MRDSIRQLFKESINVKREILESDTLIVLAKIGDEIINLIMDNNKIVVNIMK